MGLGKTLQSLITVALISLELSIIEDNTQRNNEINKIDNSDNNDNIKNNITTTKINKTKTNYKNDINGKKKNTKNENVTNSLLGGRSLVICPASLTLHWESEVKKFFPYKNLLIPQLYNGNCDDNSDNNRNSSNNDNNNNNNHNKKEELNNRNVNNNKNKNDNSMELDPSSSFSPCTVIVASYDSVRKNNLNFFTDQVSVLIVFFLI